MDMEYSIDHIIEEEWDAEHDDSLDSVGTDCAEDNREQDGISDAYDQELIDSMLNKPYKYRGEL